MTHDERDRRDWPDDADRPADTEPREDAAAADQAGSADEPGGAWRTEPVDADESRADAWPTAETDRTDSPDPGPRDDEPVADTPAQDEWRQAQPNDTEPETSEPASSSGEPWSADTVDAERAEHEAPPSEVEAYPADADAGAAAAGATAVTAHSVPSGEGVTGESTQCPRCGTENRPGLAFCRNCGQRLVAAGTAATLERPGTPEGTQACPRCGTHNRSGVAFCQNCGANLRGTAPGYVPPAVAAEEEPAAASAAADHAILGPVVLLIGLVGLVTAYLLPFAYGTGSLLDRAWSADGYGVAFWNGYPDVTGTLADQVYFGLTGPSPILALIVIGLAIAGFVRAAPGLLQIIGLVVTLVWSVGLIVLFIVVELAANWDGDLVGLLRVLTPAGIIFFLSSLILVIGSLTRFARS